MKKMNLSNKPRKPFTVPENYFEDFANQWEKSHANLQPSKKMFTLKKWMYAAAILIGIAVMGQITYLILQKQNINNANEDYELYLYSQLDKGTLYDYYFTSEE